MILFILAINCLVDNYNNYNKFNYYPAAIRFHYIFAWIFYSEVFPTL